MHARVITAQLAHDRLDEAGRHYHRPGFRGALLLVDEDTGKSLTILLWETEADLRASERDSAYPQQLAASFAGTPTREVYQVSAELISRVTD